MKKNQSDKAEKEKGSISSFFSGVAQIQGLKGTFLNELLLDKQDHAIAIVVGFNKDFVEAIFFDENINTQQPIFRSGQTFSINISDSLIGRILNGLGEPMDGLGQVLGETTPIFRQAPAIIEREPVSTPLTTGIKAIDTSLPLGRGQRELIIGDRKLGKTTLAIDIVLNQKNTKAPVYCIYVLCGQKEQETRELARIFDDKNAFLYTTIVSASVGSSFAQQYLAPFTGCAIGEYFRDLGRDALIIYDDLSKHAKIYRDISLLLGRVPGREAYPGDIFSLHAQLLERAAKLSKDRGGGSLTALPIIETQEGDITSFIPTNLISITDGQIYLQRDLFQKGFLPAINIGLSVSRVGSKAQPKEGREVMGGIRLALAQHRQLRKLSQLEATVNPKSQQKIHRGELLTELLKQTKHTSISWEEQVVLFYSIENGLFDEIEKNKWERIEKLLLELLETRHQDTLKQIRIKGFSKAIKVKIDEIILEFKRQFISG